MEVGRRARCRVRSTAALVAALSLASASATFFTASPVALAQAADDEGYKLHMGNGVKLFQDHNYEAAIVEFRAAYKAKPRPSPLVNIALAKKALFHYPAAMASLQLALDKHGDEMDAKDKKAATDAIAEMRSLLAYVTVKLSPAEATLVIDGEDQPSGTATAPVPLGPGSHKLEARADGYTRGEQTVVLASGEKDKVVSLALTPDKGYVRVHARSPAASIMVDGKSVGAGEWAGLLAPGTHEVAITGPLGVARVQVLVVAGRTVEVDPGAAAGPPPVLQPPPAPPRKPKPEEPPRRGFYGLVAASVFVPTSQPTGFNGTAGGGSVGLRAGYRLTTPFALELMYQYGDVTVTGSTPGADGTPSENKYSLSSNRIGANGRIMTSGRRVRFVLTLGGGIVFDSLKYTSACGSCVNRTGYTGFVHTEVGFELDFNGVLVGLVGQQMLGSLDDVLARSASSTAGGSQSSFAAQVGGGVRIGYALW